MQVFEPRIAFPADGTTFLEKARERERTSTRAKTPLEARRSARLDLIAVTDRLVAEFAGRLPAGTVIRHVGQAREQLLAAGVRAGLAIAAEAMARTRLLTLLPAHGDAG